MRCFSTGVSLDTPVHGCSHIVTLAPLERNYAISPIYYYYYISKNAISNKKSKHIDIRYHYVRELIQEKKLLDIVYIPTEDNLADQLTKSVTPEVLRKFVDLAMKGL